MEDLNVAEKNFYQSKFYRNILICCAIAIVIYECFSFFVYDKIDGQMMFILILGVIVYLSSWDNPILTINDTFLVFRNGIYRKKIPLVNIKSIESKGDSLYWNMKTVLIYKDGNTDKKFVIWASMVENYQTFLNFLNKKLYKTSNIYTSTSTPESVV